MLTQWYSWHHFCSQFTSFPSACLSVHCLCNFQSGEQCARLCGVFG